MFVENLIKGETKMRKLKKVMLVLMVAVILCTMCTPMASAANYNSPDTYGDIYSSLIPDEANRYVDANYQYILDVVEDNLYLFDLQSSQMKNIYIGEPYVIYNINNDCDNEIYYYPVVDKSKDEIILIINLIGTTDGWSMSIDQNFVEQLNKIDYLDNSYIIYSNDESTIAENDDESVMIEGSKNTEMKIYEKKSHSQKIKNIQNSFKNNEKVNTKNVKNGFEESVNASRGYSVNTSTNKVCTLYNSKGQGNYPICWAASVATIVNYVNGKNISAKNVCNAMDTGYIAQNISMKQKALKHYGIEYVIKNAQLSWSTVKSNINKKYPIAASLFTEAGEGHAVTIMGYREVTGSRNPRYYLTLWNSGLNEGKGGTQVVCYNINGTSVAYANKAFVWTASLY